MTIDVRGVIIRKLSDERRRKPGGRHTNHRKDPKKDEKTSWQTAFNVIECQSSQQSETLYLVNWITQRRTKHLWQIYGFVWSVSEKQPTKILELIARSKWFRKWFEAWKRFRYNFLRVWSWLRTNAGGVPNTCKSNGAESFGFLLSGERVSNAWRTCLSVGDNSWKRLLIPHDTARSHGLAVKDLSLKDGLASD